MDTPRPAPARVNESFAQCVLVDYFEGGRVDELEMATASAVRTGRVLGVQKTYSRLRCWLSLALN